MPSAGVQITRLEGQPGSHETDLLSSFRSELADIISLKRSVYQTFARQGGFDIEFGEKTCFDHERSRVILGAAQLLKAGITDPEAVDFAILHELGHLKELYDDPDGYAQVIAEGKRADGLGATYFRLYNVLMDIYVNTNTSDTACLYRGRHAEHFSEKVRDLYRAKLFEERDFSSKPLCIQYMDHLLHLGMECSRDIKLSPQVAQELTGQVSFLGEKYGYQELIDTFLRPVVGRSGDGWRASISQRKMVIDSTIRPIFEKFLRQDLAEGKDVASFGEGGIQDLNPDSSILRDILNDAKGRQAKRRMSPEERADRERERLLNKIGAESGLDAETAKDFAETYKRVYPTILGLKELWTRVRQVSVDYLAEREGLYRMGTGLDMRSVVAQYPLIAQNPCRAEVMTRQVYNELQTEHPRKIWLIMVLDLSGSMDTEIKQLRDDAVALAGSLASFNQESEAQGDDQRGVLSLVGFDDEYIPLSTQPDNTVLEDIAAVYPKFAAGGGTSDHLALKPVRDMLAASHESILSGEVLPILVEITDGDTSEPSTSSKLVEEIEQLGARVAGIRFGSGLRPDESKLDNTEHMDELEEARSIELQKLSETGETFDRIWNCLGKQRGFRVHDSSEIIPVLYRILEGALEKSYKA